MRDALQAAGESPWAKKWRNLSTNRKSSFFGQQTGMRRYRRKWMIHPDAINLPYIRPAERSRLLLREGITRIDLSAFQTCGQPLLTHR